MNNTLDYEKINRAIDTQISSKFFALSCICNGDIVINKGAAGPFSMCLQPYCCAESSILLPVKHKRVPLAYSSDYNSAFLILQRLSRLGEHWKIWNVCTTYFCQINDGEVIEADSTPLAICRAALAWQSDQL